MAKYIEPSLEISPSLEPENLEPGDESFDTISAEISNRALTTTAVLQEILAQADERRYVHHWGINE